MRSITDVEFIIERVEHRRDGTWWVGRKTDGTRVELNVAPIPPYPEEIPMRKTPELDAFTVNENSTIKDVWEVVKATALPGIDPAAERQAYGLFLSGVGAVLSIVTVIPATDDKTGAAALWRLARLAREYTAIAADKFPGPDTKQ